MAAHAFTPEGSSGKFPVPQASADRQRLRQLARDYATTHPLTPPLLMPELEAHATRLLAAHHLDPQYKEFLYILLNNEAWRSRVAAVPFHRRTFLLPPCLRASKTCEAQFDQLGLLCERCGSCDIANLSAQAEKLGYTVLVAEGTSVVTRLIEEGTSDAVVGVSCMESLERAFPRVAVAAVPSVAIPLVVDGCVDTVADVAWVREVMHLHEPAPHERALDLSAVHRQVASWFKADDLRQLISPHGTATEQIGLDWLAKDGKRWRPFLVVCTYQALAGSRNGDLPDSIRKIAIAVECIHKASLIYDDIQDNDACRYGDATVHQTHGVPVAMTAALYLLGQGYRLIAESGAPTDQTNRMLALATAGHCELCLGQGAELGWMRQPSALSSAQVLDIFRQKTAPSFEVIFGLGAIGAAAGDDVQRILRQYSQAVGVAYQIQDDLSDFTETGDVDDLAMHRPSIMLALTYEHAAPAEQKRISTLWSPNGSVISAGELRDLIRQHRVEAKTRALLDTYKEQALGALVPLTNSDLKAVLCRVVAKIFRGS